MGSDVEISGLQKVLIGCLSLSIFVLVFIIFVLPVALHSSGYPFGEPDRKIIHMGNLTNVVYQRGLGVDQAVLYFEDGFVFILPSPPRDMQLNKIYELSLDSFGFYDVKAK